MTNVGKWDRWYQGVTLEEPQTYGDSSTYEMGAKWLADCRRVEDWGCGKGGFKPIMLAANPSVRYVGIDGSVTPFALVTADLTTYVSFTRGAFMRHVLEHDVNWRDILRNFMKSWTQRGVLVVFTPLQPATHQIAWNEDPGVPDIGFNPNDIEKIIEDFGADHTRGTYRTNTQYGEETVWLMEKPPQ